MADEKQNLDGTTPIKPTPFDAHEQATRGTHVPTQLDSPDKDPATVVEFPKAVDHVEKNGAPKGHLEPVVVNNAEEEKAYLDAQAAPDAKVAEVAPAEVKPAPAV
jgi:hypothetical protein